jgi:hypothetical protein
MLTFESVSEYSILPIGCFEFVPFFYALLVKVRHESTGWMPFGNSRCFPSRVPVNSFSGSRPVPSHTFPHACISPVSPHRFIFHSPLRCSSRDCPKRRIPKTQNRLKLPTTQKDCVKPKVTLFWHAQCCSVYNV